MENSRKQKRKVCPRTSSREVLAVFCLYISSSVLMTAMISAYFSITCSQECHRNTQQWFPYVQKQYPSLIYYLPMSLCIYYLFSAEMLQLNIDFTSLAGFYLTVNYITCKLGFKWSLPMFLLHCLTLPPLLLVC